MVRTRPVIAQTVTYGKAIDLLIDVNSDCFIRVSRSYARCLGSKARGKAAACKEIEGSFLIYLMHLIVLCVYPEKFMPMRVRHPGYPDLCWLRDTYKTSFLVQLS